MDPSHFLSKIGGGKFPCIVFPYGLLTDHRIMFYLIRLRVLSRMESEEEFLNPTITGLKSIIMKLSAKSTISPRTVEDYTHLRKEVNKQTTK